MTKTVDAQTISPARAAAAAVLTRVWEASAFASAALDAEIGRLALDPRDAALATELCYGVLRVEAYLDERLAALAARRAWAKDPRVRAHILIAAYSIAFLDRVPVFAAVSEGVAGAREAGGERVAGFANAVLRKLAEDCHRWGGSGRAPRSVPSASSGNAAPPYPPDRPALASAVVASAPGWLRGALRRSLGRSGAAAFLAAGPVPPPIGLCLAPGEDRDAWIARLREAAPGADIERGLVSPRAVLVRGAGDVRKLPGAGAAWIVQEEGAQFVTLAAGARPGERVLDACAGHGNKTWLLGHEVGEAGAVDAADLHAHKLELLRDGPAGKLVHKTFAVDWTKDSGAALDGYDRVLVDAPCSGIGTLRRRPEIARRREPEDLARLAALQVSVARRAATCAKDGGRLVYAVCSVLREEAEDVVARLAEGDDLGVRLAPAPFEAEAARALAGDAPALRVLPHVQGTDGYFVASFTVRRSG